MAKACRSVCATCRREGGEQDLIHDAPALGGGGLDLARRLGLDEAQDKTPQRAEAPEVRPPARAVAPAHDASPDRAKAAYAEEAEIEPVTVAFEEGALSPST